jgi:uncharacterized protein DUF6851
LLANGADPRTMVVAGSGLLEISNKHAYYGAADGTWSQVILPGAGDSQALSIAGGSPLIAVGCTNCSYDSDNDVQPETHGAVWTSVDGINWQLVDLGPRVLLTKVGRGGAGFAALGDRCVGDGTCRWEPALWTSPDAITWTLATLETDENKAPRDVVVTELEILVLGASSLDERVTWTSQDGATWTPEVSRFEQNSEKWASYSDSVAFGSLVVQVGSAMGITGESSTSWVFDGSTWTRSPEQPQLGRGRMNGVTVVGDELVAIGAKTGPNRDEVVAWSSRDGLSWIRVSDPPGAGEDDFPGAIEAAGEHDLILANWAGSVWTGSLAAAGVLLPTPSPTTVSTPRPTPSPSLSPLPSLPSGEVAPWVQPNCHPDNPMGWSVARYWDEKVLELVRLSSPAPGVHARNLFHVSVAMWDAWAAYDDSAQGYLFHDKATASDVRTAREAAISYAAYGVLKWRYFDIGGFDPASQGLENKMQDLCYRPDYVSTTDDTPAALGNRIAAAVIEYGKNDRAREAEGYADPSYQALNDPLKTWRHGAQMDFPNHWQAIHLPPGAQTQGGAPAPSGPQKFVGAGWGFVKPFAMPSSNDGVPIDPGPPPLLGGAGDDELKDELVALIGYSAELDITNGDMVDISPGAMGNNSLGTMDGQGHSVNPATGQPYEPDVMRIADFQRALAEFWADGPNSETPPGHWNVLANAVADSPGFSFQIGGTGPALDRLEWDVKMYLALNGSVHDAAIAAWGLKRHYDSARPISLIRYTCGKGQSSDPNLPSYDPLGIPLVPGLIELVTAESSAPGQRHEGLRRHIGEIAVRSWLGFPTNTQDQISGVGWKLGIDWLPYQRASFVTPAFPGYISGHSTFSRAAAEVLTAMTGSEFFPGGLQTWTTYIGELRHELGPTTDITLQWATYYDAADHAGISRQYMGIHIAADDMTGRRVGSEVGLDAWELATHYFDGTAR